MALTKLLAFAKISHVDSKKILEDLNIKRIPVSLRLDETLWDEFKTAIKDAPQNKVLERLIREFLRGLKDKK